MSSHQQNAYTLYLRPIENIQEYQVVNAAKMLRSFGRFCTVAAAHSYLHNLELNYPLRFKAIMSKYYELVYDGHMQKKYMHVDDYTTGGNNSYGEQHMYY